MSKQHYGRIDAVCNNCGKPFQTVASQVKLGGGKFCSRACYVKRRTIPTVDRFWNNVTKTSGCWLWNVTNKSGRGHLTLKREDGTKTAVLAYRFAWELLRGPIPDGMEVCHNCPGGDNPLCVNPSHLFIGTHAENMRDAGAKQQMAFGNCHPHAKLTSESVQELRNKYAQGGYTQQALADEFGVSIGVICDAINRKSWRHVS